MHVHWTDIELEEQWSLEDCERKALMPGKSQEQRLAVAVLLKFYQLEGHFPDNLREVPEVALRYLHKSLALDVGINPTSVYHLSSRTHERHRAEIRQFLGVRKADITDQKRAKQWLVTNIITGEQTVAELNSELVKWFREQKLEPISPKAQNQLIKNANHDFEKRFLQGIFKALSSSSKQAIDYLLRPVDEDIFSQDTRFQKLSTDPGRPSLKRGLKSNGTETYVSSITVHNI